MPVRVLLPNAFQKHTNGAREITSSANNLPALISDIETTFPALKTHLRDESGQVRKFINFYVNEEDIRFLGNDKYAFKDGDEVLVIPSIAGGCCAPGDTVSAAGVRVHDHLCAVVPTADRSPAAAEISVLQVSPAGPGRRAFLVCISTQARRSVWPIQRNVAILPVAVLRRRVKSSAVPTAKR